MIPLRKKTTHGLKREIVTFNIECNGKFTKGGSSGGGEAKKTYSFKSLPVKAGDTYNKAISAEPKITSKLEELSSKFGAKMVGLDFRTKTPDSTERKVLLKAKEANISPEKAIDSMYDLVRYTQENSVDKLTENYKRTMEGLEKSGYKVIQVNNTFKPNEPYKGINIKMKDNEGNKFELQFHTPQSLEIKEEIHKLYEKARQLDSNSDDFKRLEKEMITMSSTVKEPKNINDITNYKALT